jgi:hypothetical protein
MVGAPKVGVFDMFTFAIFCSDEEIYIERQVITFVDILATAGGFANIIILLTRYVSFLYSAKLY